MGEEVVGGIVIDVDRVGIEVTAVFGEDASATSMSGRRGGQQARRRAAQAERQSMVYRARRRRCRRCAIGASGDGVAALKPTSILGLLLTVVLLFGFQAQTIIDQPVRVGIIAVPLLIQ